MMSDPLHDGSCNPREPSIRVGATTCWISLLIIFYSIAIDESLPLGEDFLLGTRAVPDNEPISTPDWYICWIEYDRAIDNIVELMRCVDEVHTIVSTTDIICPHPPADIRKEISPSARSHMDMDESSFAIMEMNTIGREDSLSDIATRYLFHIDNRRKIESLPIDIHSKIGMMMCDKWAWSEYVCSDDTEDDH